MRTVLGEDNVCLGIVLCDPGADALLLALLPIDVHGSKDTVHDDGPNALRLDERTLLRDLILANSHDGLAVDLEAAVEKGSVGADDGAEALSGGLGPVDGWGDIARKGPAEAEDGDRRESGTVLLNDCVDEVGGADCDTRDTGGVNVGLGEESREDGMDPDGWIGSGGGLVP